MKRKTIYDMSNNDRQAITLWFEREISYREMSEILKVSHENVRTHLAGLIRQMYEEKYITLHPNYDQ